MALTLLVAWVAALPFGYWIQPGAAASAGASLSHPLLFLFLLFLAPLVAGASGATVRMLVPDTGTITLKTAVLGVAAGAVASVLYVLGQLMGSSEPPHTFPILAFSVMFGFVAGFTFDAVFKKLETADVLRTEALTAKVR